VQNSDPDIHFMKMAMDQAAIAEENGDVPIGAVIVYENCAIANYMVESGSGQAIKTHS